MNLPSLTLVFLGGGLGSVLRFIIGKSVTYFFSLALPLSTLLSNVFSVFILVTILWISSMKYSNQDALRYLFIIGLCGGLSTFSTFSLETAELFKRGDHFWAITNILLNNLLCIGILLFYLKKIQVL